MIMILCNRPALGAIDDTKGMHDAPHSGGSCPLALLLVNARSVCTNRVLLKRTLVD